jgi:hypothetical protein
MSFAQLRQHDDEQGTCHGSEGKYTLIGFKLNDSMPRGSYGTIYMVKGKEGRLLAAKRMKARNLLPTEATLRAVFNL